MAIPLTSYEELPAFPLPELRELKERTLVQEVTATPPATVSLVLPTIREDDRAPVRARILRHILSEVNPLVEAGVVDEVLLVDGTCTAGGEPDPGHLEGLAEAAVEHVDAFQQETQLLSGAGGVRTRAKRGQWDPTVKLLHQRDPGVEDVLHRYSVLPEVPRGKGAALWLASVAARGDIVVFVDSDIRNFSRDFVLNLLGPILAEWSNAEGTSSTKYVKAYYNRLGTRAVEDQQAAYLGGRVTRLLVIPLFQVLAERELFQGLDGFQYPLSGEYAATRDVLETITFANGYGVEVSTLCQVAGTWGVGSMAQSNLRLFQHLSQSDDSIETMAREICQTLYTFIRKYYGDEALRELELADAYVDAAQRAVKGYEAFVHEERDRLDVPLVYDRGSELERVDTYAEALAEKRAEAELLPRWRSQPHLDDIRRGVRARTVRSTHDVLEGAGCL